MTNLDIALHVLGDLAPSPHSKLRKALQGVCARLTEPFPESGLAGLVTYFELLQVGWREDAAIGVMAQVASLLDHAGEPPMLARFDGSKLTPIVEGELVEAGAPYMVIHLERTVELVRQRIAALTSPALNASLN